MKKGIILFLFFPLMLFAQENYNSLDLVIPKYTYEEKNCLILNGGLYFKIISNKKTVLSTYYYKGLGGGNISEKIVNIYEYFAGGKKIEELEYFNIIGIYDYISEYKKELDVKRKKERIGSWLAFPGIGLVLFSGTDIILNYSITNSSVASIGIGITGLVSYFSGLYFLIDASYIRFPEKPSLELIQVLTNEYNKKILEINKL